MINDMPQTGFAIVAAETREAYAETTKRFGMWVFLAMEFMFFGAIFFIYFMDRLLYPKVFELGSQHLQMALAAVNTAILLTSSLAMAIAVHLIERGKRAGSLWALAATAGFGMAFLVLKAVEYTKDYQEGLVPYWHFVPGFTAPRELPLFMSLYFFATAIHGLHVFFGVGWITVSGRLLAKTRRPDEWKMRVHVMGLYWHFVDIVWIFLFPLFYLIRG